MWLMTLFYELVKLKSGTMHAVTVWSASASSLFLYYRSGSIVSDYGLDNRAIGVRSPAGLRIFPLTSVSRPALGPIQPPVQWVPGVLSPGVKRGRGVMLTTHTHLVPKSWMSRIFTSSPPQAPPWRVEGLLYFFTFTEIPKLTKTPRSWNTNGVPISLSPIWQGWWLIALSVAQFPMTHVTPRRSLSLRKTI
jgi:hypothetical protein